MNWPENKNFAFTIFDDADNDFLTNTRPVYDLLSDLGFRTTKSVWTLAPRFETELTGLSTEDAAYLEWIQSLAAKGFEVGWHGARCHGSSRDETIKALDLFRERIGYDPVSMSNHFQNEESIYWGQERLSGFAKLVYVLANFRGRPKSSGHREGSDFFWGDHCLRRIKYIRNFVFREIDTLSVCPFMPYYDKRFPMANAWYASSEGGDVGDFNELLREENQDRLAEQGGACIVYTHFGKGFFENGKLDSRFSALMIRLAALGGWYVPVGSLLDYLAEQNGGVHPIGWEERKNLQWRWLSSKLRHGSS